MLTLLPCAYLLEDLSYIMFPFVWIFYTDIYECKVNNGDCDHHCINSAGSYICTCDEGFAMGTDARSCLGIYNNNYHSYKRVYIIMYM